MERLKLLDLFSGIGGISRGLEMSGVAETIAFCEYDGHARKVIRKHWPSRPIFKDINNVAATRSSSDVSHLFEDNTECYTGGSKGDYLRLNIKEPTLYVGPVDMICGGYPCTGHSVAGKKEGLENEGSKLWHEYFRLIQGLKPRFVLIENSANLRSTGLGVVAKALSEEGFDLEWQVFSGYSIGAPHQRERIYIFAWRRDLPYPDVFRLWTTYSKEAETKQEWWSKRRFERDSLFEQVGSYQPRVLRDVDGLPDWLQRANTERIRRLGNSVIPQISYNIGLGLKEYLSETAKSF